MHMHELEHTKYIYKMKITVDEVFEGWLLPRDIGCWWKVKVCTPVAACKAEVKLDFKLYRKETSWEIKEKLRKVRSVHFLGLSSVEPLENPPAIPMSPCPTSQMMVPFLCLPCRDSPPLYLCPSLTLALFVPELSCLPRVSHVVSVNHPAALLLS